MNMIRHTLPYACKRIKKGKDESAPDNRPTRTGGTEEMRLLLIPCRLLLRR